MAFPKNSGEEGTECQIVVLNPQRSMPANVQITSIFSGFQPIHRNIGPQSNAKVKDFLTNQTHSVEQLVELIMPLNSFHG